MVCSRRRQLMRIPQLLSNSEDLTGSDLEDIMKLQETCIVFRLLSTVVHGTFVVLMYYPSLFERFLNLI